MVRYHLGLAAEGQAREAATCRDHGGFRVQGGCGVQGLGFRVRGLGFRVSELGVGRNTQLSLKGFGAFGWLGLRFFRFRCDGFRCLEPLKAFILHPKSCLGCRALG